ncbi:bis(5'-nucleosyl)-tetraphosphatase PrpE [Bacillus alkalicellulosilyticus]|uniref:bis(5'-nucleosyl)-tetraphosphatase PrpE n=1 Tax=Alkalihalobacterium alkalicellulosilyticum TaxID=1912214 RepID=UPI00099611E2|nr:bis(5'-nucleosyl)-tetraphosphatase PrpE [Bacillus alkalicellulosilyticus]
MTQVFDVIGDIHGCFSEFKQLTLELGYEWATGIPIHPRGRMLAFVGDLTDRGPDSVSVIKTVCQLVSEDKAYYVPGNHCDKLYRYFLGRKVQTTHGLETTVAELKTLSKSEWKEIKDAFIKLYESSPLYQTLDHDRLVIAHAGIREDYIGRHDKRVKTFVLYGDITGKNNADGTPERRDWALHYKGDRWIIYGHTPVKEVRFLHKTANIDTGCVFGGKLSALRYPEMELKSVPSTMPFVEEKFRSFPDNT